MLSESAVLPDAFFLLVHGGIGLRDGEDDLAVGFVHILNAEHTDPELLHFLLQLADKLVHSRTSFKNRAIKTSGIKTPIAGKDFFAVRLP